MTWRTSAKLWNTPNYGKASLVSRLIINNRMYSHRKADAEATDQKVSRFTSAGEGNSQNRLRGIDQLGQGGENNTHKSCISGQNTVNQEGNHRVCSLEKNHVLAIHAIIERLTRYIGCALTRRGTFPCLPKLLRLGTRKTLEV